MHAHVAFYNLQGPPEISLSVTLSQNDFEQNCLQENVHDK